MKDQKPVNNLNQNMDELEPKPQSPNQIKIPEKIIKEEKTISKKKENSKRNEKIYESNISFDELEHPAALDSDYNEESFEEVKNNFYENKKKDSLLIVEKKKMFKANCSQVIQQKMKIEQDSIQLKENIGKVVLNSKYVKDKNLEKNYSQNKYLLIKPEIVVNNFMLERSSDINKHNLSNHEVNKNNKMNNNIKINNSLKCIHNNKKPKFIKHNQKNQSKHEMGKIIKISLNINGKIPQTTKQIKNIPQSPSKLIIKNEKKNGNNNQLVQKSSKSCTKKISLKKIINIAPINNSSTIENNNNLQTTYKKLNHNYSNKIQPINITNNNINTIGSEYYTLNKSNSIVNKTINLSHKNQRNVIKICPENIEHSIRRSNEITLNTDQKNLIKRIPIPLKVNKNNNQSNLQFGTIPKEKNNSSNCLIEAHNSRKNDLKMKKINNINDYNESEKENYPINSKYDKCKKKTFQRGGKFNNISTTYVTISKTSTQKLLNSQSSLSNGRNNKKLAPNLSTASVQHNPINSSFKLNSIYPQKIQYNQNKLKTIKMNKSQNYLVKDRENVDIIFQNMNNNYSNTNYSNYPLNGEKDLNFDNINIIYNTKKKSENKPIIYKYNYIDNFWPNESFFSYFNTNGYNY